jgi:hypothetical protein
MSFHEKAVSVKADVAARSSNSSRPASIRTRFKPLTARCTLGFLVEFGAAIFASISDDRPV